MKLDNELGYMWSPRVLRIMLTCLFLCGNGGIFLDPAGRCYDLYSSTVLRYPTVFPHLPIPEQHNLELYKPSYRKHGTFILLQRGSQPLLRIWCPSSMVHNRRRRGPCKQWYTGL